MASSWFLQGRSSQHARSPLKVLGGLAAGAVVLLLVGSALPTPAATGGMWVRVNGRVVSLAESHPTVADVERASGVDPGHGDLYTALTHHRMAGAGPPGRIFVDGRPATASTRVANGAAISMTKGPDTVEPVELRQVAVAPAGLPQVETHVWHAGRAGLDDVRVGQRSGEIVARTPVRPAEPAVEDTAKVVALSFDDGPDPEFTNAILQILAEEKIKATFCIPSYQGAKHPDVVRAEFEQGHTVCDHTVHHVEHLDQRPHDVIVREIGEAADFLHSVTGQSPKFYRAPGGNLSPEVIQAAHDRGLRVLGWAVDSGDYRRPAPQVLVERILSQVTPGAVILMHDGGGNRSSTVAALKPLIEQLKAQGYGFTTPS